MMFPQLKFNYTLIKVEIWRHFPDGTNSQNFALTGLECVETDNHEFVFVFDQRKQCERKHLDPNRSSSGIDRTRPDSKLPPAACSASDSAIKNFLAIIGVLIMTQS